MNKPPQLLASPSDLVKWFHENTEEGKRSYEQGMGLRAISISGSLVRDSEPYRLTTIWRAISAQLPDDAMFVQWGDEQFVLRRPGTDRYYDEYQLLLASKSWDGPTEGQVIPLIEVIVDRATGTVTLQEEKAATAVC